MLDKADVEPPAAKQKSCRDDPLPQDEPQGLVRDSDDDESGPRAKRSRFVDGRDHSYPASDYRHYEGMSESDHKGGEEAGLITNALVNSGVDRKLAESKVKDMLKPTGTTFLETVEVASIVKPMGSPELEHEGTRRFGPEDQEARRNRLGLLQTRRPTPSPRDGQQSQARLHDR